MSPTSLGQPKESLYLFPISESLSQLQPFPIGSESKPSHAQAGLDLSYDVNCAFPTHSEASPAAKAVSKSGGNSYGAQDISEPTISCIHPTNLDISPSAPPSTLDMSPSYQTQKTRAGGEDLRPASKPSDEGSKGEVYRKKLNVEFEKLRAVLQAPGPGSDDRGPGKREILEAARLRIQGLEQECNALRTEKKHLQQQIQVLTTNPADAA